MPIYTAPAGTTPDEPVHSSTKDLILGRLLGSVMYARHLHESMPQSAEHKAAYEWLVDMYDTIEQAGVDKFEI